MKIHLESGNIYYSNLNLRESIYNFMIVQQDEAKTFLDFELDINDDIEFYLNKVISGTIDDKFDMQIFTQTSGLFFKTIY